MSPFASEPIFIGGDNRSGTTLLAILLDSHPDVVAGPELDVQEPVRVGPEVLDVVPLMRARDPRVWRPGVGAAPPFRPAVQLIKQCDRFGVPVDDLERLVARTMTETDSEIVTFEERAALLDAIGEHRRAAAGVARWALKIQRDLLHFDRWLANWPRARFVHIVRDGRDVAASHLRSDRHLFYTSITHAAEGWSSLIAATRSLVDSGDVCELRYEDLVRDPEAQLRRILEHVGLPWDRAVLDHTATPHDLLRRPHEHPSADAVGRPLNRAAIGRWRADLTPEERSVFEGVCGEWLRVLGYSDGSAEPGG